MNRPESGNDTRRAVVRTKVAGSVRSTSEAGPSGDQCVASRLPGMRALQRSLIALGISVGMISGCAVPGPTVDAEAQRKMLSLLMPNRVEIVQSFTRLQSFDDDSEPDGIDLYLRAVNALENPGLMIVGSVRVELYEFMAGSAEDRGRRLDQWEVDLSSVEQQKSYWNSLTQMYEFRLGINPAKIPPAKKYVLAVVYNSPLGEHMTDECRVEYRAAPGPLGGVRARSP